jgi:chemotaxis protein CheZ
MPAHTAGTQSDEAAPGRPSVPASGYQIVELLNRAVTLLQGEIAPGGVNLQEEIEELVHYIHSAKDEIKALRPEKITEAHIPMATDELDAIVTHTEEATDSILDAAEELEGIATGVGGDQGQRIADAATRIYEACNFQDITGQRISKVVVTLKHIEETLEALAAAFNEGAARAAAGHDGSGGGKGRSAVEISDGPASDQDLLNGPQLPSAANSQDEIDALLDDFG